MRRGAALIALALLAGCGGGTDGSGSYQLEILSGDGQSATAGQAPAADLVVKLTDADGAPAVGVGLQWRARTGCGTVTFTSTATDELGVARAEVQLGLFEGEQQFEADVSGGDPVRFHLTATAPADPSFHVLAGCNNVSERYGSDLWIADGYGYTGTWGFRGRPGNAIKIWKLDAGGAPSLSDSVIISGIGTVSDLEVSPDGKWLIATAEGGGDRAGLYVYELTTPGHPAFRARQSVPSGLHTGTLSVIGGTLYAFTAKDPSSCALQIYDLSNAAAGTITLASATSIPDHYCIHDTFVRDGLAFVFAWDEGLYIFDVGKGSNGGTPQSPVQISHTTGYGGETHNGWWFWNPNSGEKRYLFIGQEGPGTLGSSSSGSIHVVDVTDLSAPVQVATYTLPGAGTHNFWMNEQEQVLYAAFYNGGIVALDVSGTLTGDLASREIARVRPGGSGNTYMWGVMLSGGYLYGSDMLSGFWQLAVP